MRNNTIKLVMAFIAVAAMVLVMGLPGAVSQANTVSSRSFEKTIAPSVTSLSLNSNLVQVYSNTIPSGAVMVGPYNGEMHVMVTFYLKNSSRLNSFLSSLSNPSSALYHLYMTRAEFTANYSPSDSYYSMVSSYLSGKAQKITTYSDRVSIVVSANGSTIDKIFHTSVDLYELDSETFYDAANASLPQWIATNVSHIAGLQNYLKPTLLNLYSSSLLPLTNVERSHGYPVPVNGSGLLPDLPSNQTIQWLYGSDMQVAYNEQSLFNVTYATGQVAATILWAGCNAEQKGVAPFVPSDIYTYYNLTMPPGEPHAIVHGVPQNGAVAPGPSAANDTSGADLESTLDLEMLGSMAPGANIYEVYGPNSTNEEIDQSFAFILNPNATYSALNKVDVISNSYGEAECNNTVWYEYLKEAQARGISVLASSGDTGDNPTSVDYDEFEVDDLCDGRPGDLVASPAAQSYDNFGVTAVGGTTVLLNTNTSSKDFLHIVSDSAWYWNLAEGTELGYAGAAGSEGGISEIFHEPIWQLDSEANTVIQGKGRGVPDIAAIANNTMIYITDSEEGTGLLTTSGFETVAGTSVASPTEAGVVTEIDAVLQHEGKQKLGFLNPLVYSLGNMEVKKLSSTCTYEYRQSGKFNSTLSALPLMIITKGHNYVYSTNCAYSLVTGFGTIDATNFASYLLSSPVKASPFDLSGIRNTVDLESMNGTNYYYNQSTGVYQVFSPYNETLLQSFYIADSFGTPLYKVGNYLRLEKQSGDAYAVVLITEVNHPVYGLGISGQVQVYSQMLPMTISLPTNLSINSYLETFSGLVGQAVEISLDAGGNQAGITLPVPDSSFIIGAMNYTYYYQGIRYSNGPFQNSGYDGGFAPQFSLVSGLNGGVSIISAPTDFTVQSFVKRTGSMEYINANSTTFGLSGSRTDSISTGLAWKSGSNVWTVSSKAGSMTQGILFFAPDMKYTVTFNELGLPPGTQWSVNTVYGKITSQNTSLSGNSPNGTYSYEVSSSSAQYSAKQSGGYFVVNGKSVSIEVNFVKTKFVVAFSENGLPSGTEWTVDLAGMTYTSESTFINILLPNGTYSYTVSSDNSMYVPSVSSGNLVVHGSDLLINVTFYGTSDPSLADVSGNGNHYTVFSSSSVIGMISLALVSVGFIGAAFYVNRKINH